MVQANRLSGRGSTLDPAIGAYSAPQLPLAAGEGGVAAPSPKPHMDWWIGRAKRCFMQSYGTIETCRGSCGSKQLFYG